MYRLLPHGGSQRRQQRVVWDAPVSAPVLPRLTGPLPQLQHAAALERAPRRAGQDERYAAANVVAAAFGHVGRGDDHSVVENV